MQLFDSHILVRSSYDIAAICTPLKQFFDINDFNYVKIYKDHSQIKLTSRPDWIRYYYEQGFQYLGEYEIPFECIQPGYKLTSAMNARKIFTAAKEGFGIDNGIVLIDKYEDFCEMFWFGSTNNDPKAVNFYLNNMDLLRRFVLYFKEKAAAIITQASHERILLPHREIVLESKRLMNSEVRKNFIQSVRIELYRLSGKYSHVGLTEREFECAICLLEGKTAKQTSKDLEISRRTVETHLSNIKSKVNCKTKAELISIFLKNGFGVYANKDVMFI